MKVYAYFSSAGAAEAAENEVRSRISSARRITRVSNGVASGGGAFTDSVGAQNDWMFTPNGLFQGGSWTPLASQSAQPAHERRTSYSVCVEGGRECVDRAARLLRSLGGTGIIVTAG